ncbi:MAG: hypothetical protein ACK5PZ_11160, partial [Pirellula sp.]
MCRRFDPGPDHSGFSKSSEKRSLFAIVPCLLEATTPNRPLPNRPLPIDQSQAIDLKRIYSSSDFAPPSLYRTMARHPNPFLGV